MRLRFLATAAVSLAAAGVHAHGGHGALAESHWHATDGWGFLALGAVALAAWLLHRGD